MIRVLLTNCKSAYGYNVTGWEVKYSNWYDNLLTEDLIERVNQEDVIMYFNCNKLAEDWCDKNGYKYELVEPDDKS